MNQMQHVKNQMELTRNVHDIGGLDKLRQAAKDGDEKALKEAAHQFEAIFVQMMLKSMRTAQDALEVKDSPFNSQQVKFYRDMHDQQLAVDIASNGSMGLAEMIIQQLSPEKKGFTPSSLMRDGATLEEAQRLQSTGQAVQAPMVKATKQSAFESPQDFVKALLPVAEKVAAKLGLEPKALIAQAAVETGWGQYMIHDNRGNNSHNLFGIKAGRDWEGGKAAVDTLEFQQGVARKEVANFRSYNSFSESLEDYVSFVKDNPRYQEAVKQAQTPEVYFNELQRAGYATDPNYAEKIMSVFNGIRNNLPQIGKL